MEEPAVTELLAAWSSGDADAEEGKADQPSERRMPFYLDVQPRLTAKQ